MTFGFKQKIVEKKADEKTKFGMTVNSLAKNYLKTKSVQFFKNRRKHKGVPMNQHRKKKWDEMSQNKYKTEKPLSSINGSLKYIFFVVKVIFKQMSSFSSFPFFALIYGLT